MEVPTVKVKHASGSGIRIINESDYDKKVHTLVKEKAPAPAVVKEAAVAKPAPVTGRAKLK